MPLASAGADCGDYDDPCEQSFSLGKIDSIAISEGWKETNGDQIPISRCPELSPLTTGVVRKYLEHAGRLDPIIANNEISVSSCRANGELKLSDGTVIFWNIGVWRDGYVSWPHSRDPKRIEWLFCGQCEAPFYKP